MNAFVKQAGILAATAMLTVASPAFAEEEFSALQGVSAARMSTADMATTEGKSYFNFIGGALSYFVFYPGFHTIRAVAAPGLLGTCVTTTAGGLILGVGLC